MGPKLSDDDKLVELRVKKYTLQSQLNLLQSVLADSDLCASGIVSSVRPCIGKVFQYQNLEKLKELFLMRAREELMGYGTCGFRGAWGCCSDQE